MTLTENQRFQFKKNGILHLKSFVDKNAVEAVKKNILSELERLKLRTKGKISAAKIQALPFFQATNTLSQMVKPGNEILKLFPPRLEEEIDSLAGVKLRAKTPPQLLLSFPHKEAWTLQNLNWHLDITVPKKEELLGIQPFVLIEDVQPNGGATLALAGSHLLHYVNDDPGNAHAILRQDAVFGKLFTGENPNSEELRKSRLVKDISISVLEMSGQAGDVYLMDMRVLHTPSINATRNIRMMATNRYVKS